MEIGCQGVRKGKKVGNHCRSSVLTLLSKTVSSLCIASVVVFTNVTQETATAVSYRIITSSLSDKSAIFPTSCSVV